MASLPHRIEGATAKLEAQADVEGMKELTRAGISVADMTGMFRGLQSEAARIGDDIPGLPSSHPEVVSGTRRGF
jgi:predicted Zn-dependent protease